MRVMSAGDGYKYLLRTVVVGDGKRSLSTPLTRYYSAEGTPPGRWMGDGLRSFGAGLIMEGAEVTEEQLQFLIGQGRDPLTGEALGRAYPVYRSARNMASTREKRGLDTSSVGDATAPASSANEDPSSRRRAVAGYDFTFSIPKSASVLWGIADASTQARIVRAHHAAVAEAVAYLEREAASTRTGATARDGAVAQVGVTGLIATAFDHFDSRAGDPHLHTHVVISNKVKTALDGKWRSLDGRPMHAIVVALSELHEALFADALTRELGVIWERRERGRDRHPAWAISSVPDDLVAEFSTRSRHIDVETDRLIDEFVNRNGYRPSPVTITKLRAQATLTTRPAKHVHSLSELTEGWRARATQAIGQDATAWAMAASSNRSPALMRAEDMPLDTISDLGSSVMSAVSEKRSTWRHGNLAAEAARQTMQFRFIAAIDREVVVGLVTDAAERASLQLTPPDLAPSPAAFQRDDGTSVFRQRARLCLPRRLCSTRRRGYASVPTMQRDQEPHPSLFARLHRRGCREAGNSRTASWMRSHPSLTLAASLTSWWAPPARARRPLWLYCGKRGRRHTDRTRYWVLLLQPLRRRCSLRTSESGRKTLQGGGVTISVADPRSVTVSS